MLLSKSHDCPKCGGPHENACFVTYDNGWHCFSCGASYVTDVDNYSFRAQKTASKGVYIPEHITFNPDKFSLYVLNWLYQYGLYKSDIKKYNIGYIPYEEFKTKSELEFKGESLLFPIISNLEIGNYQRRFFPDKKILTVGNKELIFLPQKDSSFCDKIVLVEDYISAIKVSGVIPSMCLFGTKLKENQLEECLRYRNIIIWLDGDKPGQDGANKIYKKLCDTIKYRCKLNAFNSMCYNVRIITTDNDPKTYSSTEINTILNCSITEGKYNVPISP